MVFGPTIAAIEADQAKIGLNALTGIDGFWTLTVKSRHHIVRTFSLNALTGIDGFWTNLSGN